MRVRTWLVGSMALLSAVNCSDDDSEDRGESGGNTHRAGTSAGTRLVSQAGSVTVSATAGGTRATYVTAHVGGATVPTAEQSGGAIGSNATDTATPFGTGGTSNGVTTAAFGGSALGAAGSMSTSLVVCGDGRCEASETSSSCCSDCGCSQAGTACHGNICVTPIAISAGGFHTCALLADGTAECWGGNSFGEIGNGTSGLTVESPTTVSGLTRAKAIAAGASFTCALVDDGTVKCWGANESGQLGTGTLSASSTPVTVSNLTGVAAIAAGYRSACALLATGAVRCWGKNDSGQLGDGSTTNSPTPVSVAEIEHAKSVTVGSNSACAALDDGTARCWGDNRRGQLGDGTTANSTTPVTVELLSGATAISSMCNESPLSSFEETGDGSACALLQTGSLKCWGSNTFGELGKGNMMGLSTRPVPVMDLQSVTSISSGNKFACAVDQARTVHCWGSNAQGQLGDGTDNNSATPVPVSNLSNAMQVATGLYHACALQSSGGIQCWGSNTRNELGRNDLQSSRTPVSVQTWIPGAVPAAGGQSGGGVAGAGGAGGATPASGGALAAGGFAGASPTEPTVAGAGGGGSLSEPTVAGAGGSGGSSNPTTPACSEGISECDGRRAVRSCTGGVWAESACGAVQACSAGACRDGCPELTIPAGTEFACFMPVDPFGSYHGAPCTAMPLVSDPNAVPSWTVSGMALDTRDTDNYSDDTPATASPDAQGLIWRAPSTTRTVGRLYLSGYLDMVSYISKHGAPPSSIALHVKMRRIADATRRIPWPAFSLVDGANAAITFWHDESAIMQPTTAWAVYSREFTSAELSGLDQKSDSNWYELDFGGDSSHSIPPEDIEVAWFAVTYGSPD